MTAIVGIKGQSEIVIAADSGLTIGDRSIVGARKVARRNIAGVEILVAAAGPWRACQCALQAGFPGLQPAAVRPRRLRPDDHADVIADAFVDAVRAALIREPGGAERAADEGLELMMAAHGRLFVVEPGGGVFEPACGYAAIGNGGQVALGALDAIGCATAPEGMARVALAIAERHVAGVRGPWIVEKMEIGR